MGSRSEAIIVIIIIVVTVIMTQVGFALEKPAVARELAMGLDANLTGAHVVAAMRETSFGKVCFDLVRTTTRRVCVCVCVCVRACVSGWVGGRRYYTPF